MADSPPPNGEPEIDSLTQLQRKIDDIGVMFYTNIGIIQRDAPPVARPPDEADELANDATAVKELSEKAPEFAKDIVRTSKEIDETINLVETELLDQGADQKALMQQADAASLAAGKELEAAAEEASKLLADIRNVIALRDQDDLYGPSPSKTVPGRLL